MPLTAVRVFRSVDGDAPLTTWLDELAARAPKAFRRCLQRIMLLGQLGHELRRPLADTLRDGVHELRTKDGRVQYRILYFFSGANEVCLSHGIIKKREVPAAEIDLAVKRKKLVAVDPQRYTVEWET